MDRTPPLLMYSTEGGKLIATLGGKGWMGVGEIGAVALRERREGSDRRGQVSGEKGQAGRLRVDLMSRHRLLSSRRASKNGRCVWGGIEQ